MTSLAKRLPPPPGWARRRLLTVGPIPPEWGGRLRGGVTRFNVTLLDEFRSRPWRYRVDPIGVLIPPPQRIRRSEAEELSPLPIYMPPREGRPRRFTRLLLERAEPDVILLNNIAAFNGARFARVKDQVAPELPTVGVVHEWRAIWAKEDPERRERYMMAAQRALDAVDAVVFPSEHTLKLGRDELGLRYPERSLVIGNPLQPAFARRSIDVSAEPRDGVAFVGSLNERKNPSGLLRAVETIPDLRLTMQGRGPERGAVKELVAELGIGDRVELAPFRPTPRHVHLVGKTMRQSELLCLPSFSESFALVIIEALSMGTPVAGFGPTLVEIRDRLGIEIGEPIWDPTPENIATAIEAVRARSWDPRRLRRATLDAFSPESVARRYGALLRSVR